MDNQNPTDVVVLIHGTWAQGTTWIQRDSWFSQQIVERLNSEGVKACVEPFDWSGSNSERARQKAARALRERLAEIRKANPSSQIVLIGHSHGGTVALEAYNDSGIGNLIDRIICLGTPFLYYHERDVAPAAAILASASIALLCLFLMWCSIPIIGAVLLPYHDMVPSRGLVGAFGLFLRSIPYFMKVISVMMVVGAAVLPLFLLAPLLRSTISRKLTFFQRRWIERQHRQDASPRMLVIYTGRDEARRWLTRVESAWRPVFWTLWVLGQIVLKMLVILTPILVWLVVVSVLVAPMQSAELVPIPHPSGAILIAVVLFVAYGTPLAAVVLLAMVVAYGAIFSGGPVGFGTSGLINCQIIGVRASEYPIGFQVEAAPVEFKRARLISGLRHSMFYGSQEVVDVIVGWRTGRKQLQVNFMLQEAKQDTTGLAPYFQWGAAVLLSAILLMGVLWAL